MMSTPEPLVTPPHKPIRIIIALVLIALVAAVVFVLIAPNNESTSDAQIDGHIHPVNARVAGTIIWVNPRVDDTHFIEAGTVIARLDPNDYVPTVNRLSGEEHAAQAQLAAAKLNIPIAQATAQSRLSSARAAVNDSEAELSNAHAQRNAAVALVSQATASALRAEDDRVRYEALAKTHEISISEYDLRATEAKTSAALKISATANLDGTEQRIISARQKIVERQGDLQAAKTAPEFIATAKANVTRMEGALKTSEAALYNAHLDLGYTDILAPVSGIIGRKQIESGQRVSVGQLLLTLAPPKDIWVVANFRETQLHHMRIGQAATIHVDAYDRFFTGNVESIGGATGSKYSLIAPENATGNYVKVVQRIPVRIRLTDPQVRDQLIVPGMSVEVVIHVGG